MTVPTELTFGFSPCPNDTFAFHHAVHGGAAQHGLRLVPQLLDIEALNERAVRGDAAFDVTKLSIPALAQVADRYAVLPSGAALGFGCGPLLVRRAASPLRSLADLAHARVAIAGLHTTAHLLLRCLAPALGEVVPMRFDAIMAAVAAGNVDAGLVIHEGRFTFRERGLVAIADLGELWEQATGGPLPLAVIAARRDLDASTLARVGAALRESVQRAKAAPDASRDYVRAHAQELDDAVCAQHIALYVNDFSIDLGDRGRRAIEALVARGRAVLALPQGPAVFLEDA